MAEVTITKSTADLKTVFNQMREVYYSNAANTALASLASFDMELPVTEDGVTFNLGDPDITKVKLTNGETWTAIASPGDAEITFQIPSVAEALNELFLTKIGSAESTMASTLGGVTYKGYGYSSAPKKVTGALFLRSEDRQAAIYLPNVEMYGVPVIEDDKPAYFNVNITPLADTTGATIYLLAKSAS